MSTLLSLLDASVNSILPSEAATAEAAAFDDVTVGAGEAVATVEAGEADVCATAGAGDACKAATVLGAAAGEVMLFVDVVSFLVIVASVAAGLALSSVDDDGFWDSPVVDVVSMVFCKPTQVSLEKRQLSKAVEGDTTSFCPPILFVDLIIKKRFWRAKRLSIPHHIS